MVFRAVLQEPLAHVVVLLYLSGMLRLWNPVVDRKDARRVRAGDRLTENPVVGLLVSEDPARTVDVERYRQWPAYPLGPDDAGLHGAPLSGVHLDPLLVDVRARHALAALQIQQDLAALLRGNLIDVRMRIGLLSQFFRGGFEDRNDRWRNLSHVRSLPNVFGRTAAGAIAGERLPNSFVSLPMAARAIVCSAHIMLGHNVSAVNTET